jgi:hypothetical protein
MNEFTHIEINVIRNPEWLKVREKKGFFLSESFPLGEYTLPPGFESMNEQDIDRLIEALKSHVTLIQKELKK